MMKRITVLLVFLIYQDLLANNLQVTGLKVENINEIQSYANVQFSVSWDNSWKDDSNWDAVWIFLKFKEVGNTGAWRHATLNTSGHLAPSGSTILAPADGKGFFLYRSENGNGPVNYVNVQVQWNFGEAGLTPSSLVDIKVFAIEMVYVPQGSFYVGDGQTDNTQLYGNFEAGDTGVPFQVTSESEIVLGGGTSGSLGNNNAINHFSRSGAANVFNCQDDGCLGESGDDFDDVISRILPAAYPKGFQSFYCMKYEITQEQFVDMLNCLTPAQQSLLAGTSSFYVPIGTLAENRYSIVQSGEVFVANERNVPMIYCDWIKAAAYADWSALRPMTELEFEKASRGFNTPVTNEYAWGNANLDIVDNLTLSDFGSSNEGIASGYNDDGINGNAWTRAGGQTMPYLARVGIFAAHPANNGRVSSGGSAWGIMELSGNAWERAVSVGHAEGRKFTGNHGDGDLDPNGYASVPSWPGVFTGSIVNTNVGVGYRGGGLAYPNPDMERNARISSRRLASGYFSVVINDDGARLVRTGN